MTTTPVASLFSRLSEELRQLAAATGDFHHLAARGGDAAMTDNEFVRAAQSIDLTQQILANLSDFAASVGQSAPADWELQIGEALAAVTLADLIQRLGALPAQAADERGEAGDLELFG